MKLEIAISRLICKIKNILHQRLYLYPTSTIINTDLVSPGSSIIALPWTVMLTLQKGTAWIKTTQTYHKDLKVPHRQPTCHTMHTKMQTWYIKSPGYISANRIHLTYLSSLTKHCKHLINQGTSAPTA